MNRNYLLTYEDASWAIQYAWFGTEEELIEFIDTHTIKVVECVKIIACEDLTERYN